jgi:hypothetical protein
MKHLSARFVTAAICLLSLLSFPVALAGNDGPPGNRPPAKNIRSGKSLGRTKAQRILMEADSVYRQLDLASRGLTRPAFLYAWKGYVQLKEKGLLQRDDILSICDFSQSSRRRRLYIINLGSKELLLHTYVAHGRNSGGEFARKFSNRPESHQSSLGFYITRQTYYGEHGLSLRIDGLEIGFNDKARYRKIVIHGSDYIGTDFLRDNKFNGRSFGCPAVPLEESSDVINTIKEGTCLFIYYPSKTYISKSGLLKI